MDPISAAAALRFFFFFVSLLSALLLLNASSAQAQKPRCRTFASSKITSLLGDPLSPAAQAQQPQRRTFSFSTFVQADVHNFSFSFDSGNISQGALQLTPRDTSNDRSCFVNRSGRILFADPFHVWQNSVSNSTKHIASFNTSFTVNVHPLDKYVDSTVLGHGLAFLIAPSLGDPPAESFGQYLGLTNNTLDGDPSNRIVAVELDTFKQSFDPDGNHIGLDINSVRSNITAPLSRFEIEISPSDGSSNNVWIDYNGSLKYIWVYMAPESRSKPSTPVLEAPLDLSEHVNNLSYFGFAASTGDAELQLNCVKAWNLSVELLPDNNNKNNSAFQSKTSSRTMVPLVIDIQLAKAIAVAMVVATVVAAAVAVGVLWCFLVKRKKVGDDPSVLAGTLQRLPGTPREFELKVLKKATNNFDERLRLGHGGFGIVYKGVIHGEDTEVAVKKFSRDNVKGRDDFLAELSIINRLRHKHLVRLLGWCHKRGMLLLVYEYMPNGSLDQHLSCAPNRPILAWDHRYNILTGVASALHYLHNEYDQRVVHRDLKPSNILLDSNYNARLGDFGLARALDTDRTSYFDVDVRGVAGTMGYIAPECFHMGVATSESDVFGFGAVVLEVVCGRRPQCDISGFQFLADWVWKLHREDRILDAVDYRLDGRFVREDVVRLLLLGLACTHPSPKERPKTAAVLQIISRSVAPPVVPPFRPAFVWPSGRADDGSCSDSMTSTGVTSQFYASSA